jgi:indolepyruvate ferredoxin oxidoreductase
VRIADGRADALVACDVVVGTDPRAIRVLSKDRTRVLVNHSEVPSGQFVQNRNADIRMDERLRAIASAVGSRNLEVVEANALMEALMGHTVYANVFMLGHAWQQGLVPVSETALLRAIELNDVNVEQNQRAFNWGRLSAMDADYVIEAAKLPESTVAEKSLPELIEHRAALLVAYQNRDYADAYRALVARVQEAEQKLGDEKLPLTRAVATHLYKLMAYKDEYEVARLYSEPAFQRKLSETFTGDYTLSFHLAPPIFNRGRDGQGRPLKRRFGPWMLPMFKLLARAKFLRGTAFDPFGRLAERREERALIEDYRSLVEELLAGLTSQNLAIAVDCASSPDQVRGYGPVKTESIAEYRRLRAGLLHRFHNPSSVVQIQDVA